MAGEGLRYVTVVVSDTWSSVRQRGHWEDWPVLVGQRSSCTALAAACRITAAADAVEEQTHFAGCSHCPEERCWKTCLGYLPQSTSTSTYSVQEFIYYYTTLLIGHITNRPSTAAVCLSVCPYWLLPPKSAEKHQNSCERFLEQK